MKVARRGIAQRALQPDLTRRRCEQIGAAHDIGDPLLRVVDDHRKLVSEESVGAPDHEIADVTRKLLLLPALKTVSKPDGSFGDGGAPRPGARSLRPSTACPRICPLSGGPHRPGLELLATAPTCGGKAPVALFDADVHCQLRCIAARTAVGYSLRPTLPLYLPSAR